MCLETAAIDRLERLGGADLLHRMIVAFLDSVPPRLADAQEGWRNRDLGMLERAVHSMKSSAANFGATRLVEVAARIEQLAVAGDQVGLEPLMEEMPGLFEKVRRRLMEIDEGLER